MPEISNAAIGRLAMELAEKDSFLYQIEYTQPARPGVEAQGKLLTLLDDEGRQKYRALARQQLEREAKDAQGQSPR